MIDLSFLTEEEQISILAVLRRDAELKKAEERRIENLQKTVNDRSQLRYFTGEWFYETKQLRHQDRIHGSDIIMASMRDKQQQPLTVVTVSHVSTESTSIVLKDKAEVLLTPLHTRQQESDMVVSAEGVELIQSPIKTDDVTSSPVLKSLIKKKRENPFNLEPTIIKKDIVNLDQTKTDNDQPAISSKSSIFDAIRCDLCAADNPIKKDASISLPRLERRFFSMRSQECTSEVDVSGSKRTSSSEMHVILKNLSASTSVQSLFPPPDPPSPTMLDVSKKSSESLVKSSWMDQEDSQERDHLDIKLSNIEAKDVAVEHYSEPVVPAVYAPGESCAGPVELHPKLECHSTAEARCQFEQKMNSFEKHSNVASLVDCDSKSFLGVFSQDNGVQRNFLSGGEETAQMHSAQKIHLQRLEQESLYHESTKDETLSKAPDGKQEFQSSQSIKFRSLHLSKLQNHPFKDTLGTADDQQEGFKRKGVELTKKKAFRMIAKTNVDLTFSKLDTVQEAKTKIIHFYSIHQSPRMKQSSLTSQTKTSTSGNRLSSCIDKKMNDSSKDNGTSRDDPAFIRREQDDSTLLTELKITEPEDNINLPFNTRNQEKLNAVNLPAGPITSALQGGLVSDAKQSLEKRYPSPDRVSAEVRNDANSLLFNNRKHVSQSKVRLSSGKRNISEVKSSEPICSENPITSQCIHSLHYEPARPQHNTVIEMYTSHIPTSSSQMQSPSMSNIERMRKSPGKTYHPKVLPQEEFNLRDSLKTFPIVINSTSAVTEKQQKSELTHSESETSTSLNQSRYAATLPLDLMGKDVAGFGPTHAKRKLNTLPSPPIDQDTQKKQGTFTHLAKMLLPLHHHKKAHTPPSIKDASYIDTLRPKREGKDFVNIYLSTEQNTGGSPTQAAESKTRSQSQTSSGPLTPSRAKMIKTSYSLPLQLDQRDNDNTYESSFGQRRYTNSSISTMSFSSGLDSMSSMSSSLSSIYPVDIEDTNVQGSIQFALNYIQKLGEFQIFVVLCRGLAVADTKKNRTDPYVKCHLFPDKMGLGKKKTTVKKKTLSPTYNEVLRFKVSMKVLKTLSLNISVCHKDTFGQRAFLGEMDLDLSKWDFSNTQINEYALKPKIQESTAGVSSLTSNRGEMRVALRFVRQSTTSSETLRVEMGEVQIWVKDCKNLPVVRGAAVSPFVKCTVLPDVSWKSRQKTRVVKWTSNPMFNHTMVYDGFRPEDLKEICVEITVWDHDHLKNHYIGGLRLGMGTGKSYEVDVTWMNSTALEVSLWRRMFESKGEWVEEVLPLRVLEAGSLKSK